VVSFQAILTGTVVQLLSLQASLVALALMAAPNANRADCGDIAGRYAAAVAKVVEAVRTYERCVSASDKRDDCADEMQALDTAHDDFADVVDDAKECR
jgi:hypothetical protein